MPCGRQARSSSTPDESSDCAARPGMAGVECVQVGRIDRIVEEVRLVPFRQPVQERRRQRRRCRGS